MASTIKPLCLFSAALISLGVLYARTPAPAAPQGSPVVVKMTAEHKFMPAKLTIKVGQTVEWDNDEPNGLHQVTDDQNIATDPDDVALPDGATPFNSKSIKSGQSYQEKFTVPGVYKYVCPPHEQDGMVGQITVTK